MKFQILVLLFLILFQSCSSQKNGIENISNVSKVDYENLDFSFKVSVPKSWKAYDIQNDTVNRRTFINWGIPKIYSEIEKTKIENSVSIRAFERKSINSVEDIILEEYLRIDPLNTSLKLENESGKNARIIYYTDSNGLNYKGKSYFEFHNGISYIVTFMATLGTYEKNIELFENFYSTLILE